MATAHVIKDECGKVVVSLSARRSHSNLASTLGHTAIRECTDESTVTIEANPQITDEDWYDRLSKFASSEVVWVGYAGEGL
jgi:hypothetical protein